MNANERKLYQESRKAGYRPVEAIRAARIVAEFESWGDDVEIIAEPDCERHVDVFGEPEPYVNEHGRTVSAKEQLERIERVGMWSVSSYVRDPQTGDLSQVDAIHGCDYERPDDWRDNAYVVDLMEAALQVVRERFAGV